MELFSLHAFSVETLLIVAIGLVLMILVLAFLGKVMPFSMKTAISEKRNDAVSVILFSVLLGLCIIVSSVFTREQEGKGEGPASSASAQPASSVGPATLPSRTQNSNPHQLPSRKP